MTDDSWQQLVKHLVEASDEEVRPEDVTRETSLREQLDLGSLQAITLVMDLEENFGIVVEDEELERLETVGDIHDLILRKLEQAPSGDAS
ncbi:MAG: phosphopantetheine-binding protein [Thermoanaerobaculia bacterium]|nr:phosphopantetheine-binding protein [Thermoanaerobaculia bacterium]